MLQVVADGDCDVVCRAYPMLAELMVSMTLSDELIYAGRAGGEYMSGDHILCWKG
jgi:hypothetical protein